MAGRSPTDESRCHGDALPDRWYRKRKWLRDELAAHGTLVAAARAHQVSPASVQKGWQEVGLGPLPRGSRSAESPGEAVSEVETLRARLAEAERHIRKARTGEVQAELLAQRITSAVQVAAPRYTPPRYVRTRKDERAQEAALLFSDAHASEVVRAEEVLGVNEYDWDVMLARMAKTQASVLSHVQHCGYPVPTLHLWLLGDNLSGNIHEELMQTNDRPAAQAVVDFAYEFARFVEGFAPHFRRILISGVPGNHPRLTKKPQAKLAYDNGDWISYKIIEALLAKHPAVKCDFPRASYAVVTAAERWRVLLMHGDGIRSTMPGVPWGGISRRVTQLEQQFSAAGRALDMICLGHFHSANALDGVQTETFMNGSLKGVDEYSLRQFGGGRAAKQRLLMLHPRWGVTSMHWLTLQENIPALERRPT